MRGEAAFAPRKTNPNPRLPLWSIAFRHSPGTLKNTHDNILRKNTSIKLNR